MPFNTFEDKAFTQLLEMAIAEDIDSSGDLTSKATLPADLMGKATLVGRADGVLAGIEAGKGCCEKLPLKLSGFPL